MVRDLHSIRGQGAHCPTRIGKALAATFDFGRNWAKFGERIRKDVVVSRDVRHRATAAPVDELRSPHRR